VNFSWFAIAAPGLEKVVCEEVAALSGVAGVNQVPGGVEFSGPLEVGMRANLRLRVATRILLRLGTVEARKFPELRRRLARLPWEDLVPRDRPLRVEAAASRCRLYHTGALGENLELGVADALGGLPKTEDEPTRVLIRGHEDRFTVSLDSSGELLHRRGWRLETGKAPLRETLAAGLLRLAGYDPERPFLDPMCGSGTIVLEACAIALGVAPGLARPFAFERWRSFDPAAWDRLRDEALAEIRDRPPAPLHAWDRDPEAVATTRRNAERAGFLAHLGVEQAVFGEQAPPEGAGLVLVNPPYGRRLERAGNVERVLRARFAGWRTAVLVPGDRGPGHRLHNGGLRVRLVVANAAGRRAPGYH
jgi:putative N6-adenine-specific DNA methylase